MKFSDITKQQWDELKPYLDTCLLPFTGLQGNESPWETTTALERLRDAMDTIEHPFKGRIVTYPAYHYHVEGSLPVSQHIDEICKRLKQGVGFSYVIVVCAQEEAALESCTEPDLILTIQTDDKGVVADRKEIQEKIQQLWFPS